MLFYYRNETDVKNRAAMAQIDTDVPQIDVESMVNL